MKEVKEVKQAEAKPEVVKTIQNDRYNDNHHNYDLFDNGHLGISS